MAEPAVFSPDDLVGSRRERILSGAPMIEVRDVAKTFRIPQRGAQTFTERLAHPFSGSGHRVLPALKGVSFDVHQGEFFGIVGRNGSGKSTLLKILSSIYRADSGTIRMAGRLAPFIELGVGFNPDLTARENVALNGVMMGLGRREAAQRLDAVLDFAGLREFVDLKLKNYSSGMMVRLAFAAMVEADADVMLVDEVLAVGDASFAQKCMDVFREKRRNGKTLVLVTHDMATVQSFCDRAMLLHDGEMQYVGDPEEAALRYFKLNFGNPEADGVSPESAVKLVDAWVEDAAGSRAGALRQREPITIQLVVEARQEIVAPAFGFEVHDTNGTAILGFGKMWEEGEDDNLEQVQAGCRLRVTGRVENPLVPGPYTVGCSIARDRTRGDVALKVPELVAFEVLGPRGAGVAIEDHQVGMVAVREDVTAIKEQA
jgi:ABC-2 type transport system ATP-binding protein